MSNYEDLLAQAFETMPEVVSTHSRWNLPDPVVRPEGNVTVYENFKNTVDVLNREADFVLKFLQNEFGTSANIDETGRARLTGSFSTDRVALVINSFSNTYVICPDCGLPDTKLQEKNNSLMIHCEGCGILSKIE
ncbi:MAG: translation initiation factor IF-2 subunit beta [Halobacteriales archaeon]|nr:translation initiation factor IF-2 subunit beta [Halobacteriales archaeon]|tara:strand:+ start:656 stop:1060 length:405 start_codon:yes stop_codon:yes gene_type:complete